MQEATAVSSLDEDAEMMQLLHDNGESFPTTSGSHQTHPYSSGHTCGSSNSQGGAVALAADAPTASSHAMATAATTTATATSTALRPSPQASALVRSRQECAAKLEHLTRGTGIGVAFDNAATTPEYGGSSSTGRVAGGDPAQMLANACQQYLRRVMGDVQR